MAAYNGERFLREAIDSVLAQTFPDFELIIIDDCSTDRTFEIIQSYVDERIRLIQNAQNLGAAETRNVGLRQARGEYIAILDCDDIARPDRFMIQAGYLDQHPDVMLISSACIIIDENSDTISTYVPPVDPVIFRWVMLIDNQIYHSTVMYRKTVGLEFNGYERALVPSEDYDLWCKIIRKYGYVQMLERVTYYRVHHRGLTFTQSKRMGETATRIIQENIQDTLGKRIEPPLIDALLKKSAEPGSQLRLVYQWYFDLVKGFAKRYQLTREERLVLWGAVLDELLIYAEKKEQRWGAFRLGVKLTGELARVRFFSKRFLTFVYRALVPVEVRNNLFALRRKALR
jgi:glycosyltransferase involved in cell wall biosynthesis